jgi:hypothetical protein
MRGALTALAIWFCALIPDLAQDKAPLALVGVMGTGAAANNEPFATLFREELATLGDVEGRNVRLDLRLVDGDYQRFPEMAEALVKERPASLLFLIKQPPARHSMRPVRSRSWPSPATSLPRDWAQAWRSQAATSPGSA